MLGGVRVAAIEIEAQRYRIAIGQAIAPAVGMISAACTPCPKQIRFAS